MAAKKASPAMDFIVEQLKKNRKAGYAEIKSAADGKKLKVYPIMFGRAQALLGIVKSRPRGQGKAAVAARAASAPAASSPGKRGPGRPRKNLGLGIDTSSLDGIIAAVKTTEAAKARYRAALERIQSILGAALEA
jgi:hypothetical protein